MRIPSIITLLFATACSSGKMSASEESGLIGESDRPAWDPDPQTIDNGSSSSTVSWTPPDEEDGNPSHYNVVVTSEFDAIVYESAIADTRIELTNLRTDTEYRVDITACYDADCSAMLVGEPIQAPSWRTEIESWIFPDINGEAISPLFSNSYAPTLINLSELPINQEGWVLTSIQNDGSSQQVQVSILRDLFIEPDGERIDFVLETPLSAGVQDVPDVIDFTSSSARAIQFNEEWTLELFVSLEANIGEERSMIGSWTSETGVTNINIADDYGSSEDLCVFNSLYDTCGMNTCMDSQSDSGTLANMDCISLIPNVDDLMLIQGRVDSTDNTAPNLYIARPLRSGEWSVLSQNNQTPTPILKDATGASVRVENDIGKLYYWDENSGSAYIRYWDPAYAGEPDTFELEDLESEDRVRHVYYKDQSNEVMLPWNFKVVERTFLTKNEQQVMLATVETSDGKRHITFGVLSNP